jgi:hypothetical protein
VSATSDATFVDEEKRKTQMPDEIQPEDLTKKRVVYQIPGMNDVKIRRDVEYRVTETGAQTMDVYYPPDWQDGARLPAVVFVSGFSDLGFVARLGCKLNEMASYISWGQLAAASGLVAITYSTSREPAADIYAVLDYVRQHAASIGIDESRIGVWACSGNVPNALSVLMQENQDYLKCAALCYGYMLDLEDTTRVADIAKAVGFVNPSAGKSVADLPKDLPLFIVRSGQDEMPYLNETIDRFLAHALIANLPITFANHPQAPHAFDLMHDSETSREIIRQILAFLRFHLLVSVGA